MSTNLFGSICLSDIPKELITTGNNGKKYLSVVVNERRETGKYGHTHYIKAYAKKGTVPEGTNLYVGELKPSAYDDEPQRATAPSVQAETAAQAFGTAQPLPEDDLPF